MFLFSCFWDQLTSTYTTRASSTVLFRQGTRPVFLSSVVVGWGEGRQGQFYCLPQVTRGRGSVPPCCFHMSDKDPRGMCSQLFHPYNLRAGSPIHTPSKNPGKVQDLLSRVLQPVRGKASSMTLMIQESALLPALGVKGKLEAALSGPCNK